MNLQGKIIKTTNYDEFKQLYALLSIVCGNQVERIDIFREEDGFLVKNSKELFFGVAKHGIAVSNNEDEILEGLSIAYPTEIFEILTLEEAIDYYVEEEMDEYLQAILEDLTIVVKDVFED